MNWLNIHLSTLRSPEFIGSEPVQRSTWLSLLAYCCDQENSGIIKGCKSWGDRKWMQLVGVFQSEVCQESCLWSWTGENAENLEVKFFSKDKQREVKRLRKQSQTAAELRWKAHRESLLDDMPTGMPKGNAEKEREREGQLERETEVPPAAPGDSLFVGSKFSELWAAYVGFPFEKCKGRPQYLQWLDGRDISMVEKALARICKAPNARVTLPLLDEAYRVLESRLIPPTPPPKKNTETPDHRPVTPEEIEDMKRKAGLAR